MAGRPRTRTDEEIFAATERVIARTGPDELTLALVAKEAGLAASTLAERFGSKRALLLATARASVPAAREAFARARVKHPGDPLAALHDALRRLAAPLASRPAFANHVGWLRLDVGDREFLPIAVRHTEAVRACIAEHLQEAVDTGALRKDTDVAALARAVHVAQQGSILVWALSGRGPLADTLRADVEVVLSSALPVE